LTTGRVQVMEVISTYYPMI